MASAPLQNLKHSVDEDSKILNNGNDVYNDISNNRDGNNNDSNNLDINNEKISDISEYNDNDNKNDHEDLYGTFDGLDKSNSNQEDTQMLEKRERKGKKMEKKVKYSTDSEKNNEETRYHFYIYV